MANILFNGIILSNALNTTETDWFPTNIDNQAVSYQGYFYSSNPALRPHKWSDVRLTGTRGQIDINLGATDWLGSAGTAVAGDKVILVFWLHTTVDRLDAEVVTYPRGWFEITLVASTGTYTNYPLIGNTKITHNYWDDMPPRWGVLDRPYNMNYNSEQHETYLLEPFLWYNQIVNDYLYSENTITMSHEASVYGVQIFPTITSIKEILTFLPEDEGIERNVSTVTTEFQHSFETYQRHRLVRTLSYLVSGTYYDDITVTTIRDYFVELIIRNPGILDIDVYKDRDFSLVLNTDRVDFWTFKARIKETFASDIVLADFDIDINLEDEKLTLSLDSPATNMILNNIGIKSNTTSTIKQLVWDLKITNPLGNTYNLIQGNCFLHNTVTKS